ncbi:MAG: serine hydrolase [Proteobacteria bacterium]|nr:serine hydrolase [Pseudomonadota bacterium]
MTKTTAKRAAFARLLTGVAMATAIAMPIAQAKPTPDQQAAIAKLFPDSAEPGIPGCTVDVRKGSKPIFELTYGLANLEFPTPIKFDTIFEAGSVSKQFVGAGLALLATQGKLSLDDDIRKYLTEMPDYGAVITIRNLLNNTSGIRDWHDLTELQGWSEGTRAHTQDFAVKLIARQEGLNFAPGSEYSYSNSNFILGATIIARVSGKTLDAFSQDAFFKPMGMTKTQWRKDFRDTVPGRAQGYGEDESGAWKLDMPFESTMGGGGLLTTVGDLQTWGKTISAATAPWVKLLIEPGKLRDGHKIAYALGIELHTIKGASVLEHSGWTAGYKAYLGLAPAQDLSAAIMCNTSAINTEDVGPQLLGAFFTEVATPATASVPPPAANESLTAKLSGKYRITTTGAIVEVTAKDGGVSFNGGATFRGGAGGLYRNDDGSREARVTQNSTGGIASIRLTRTSNSDLELTPITPWVPAAADLKAFEGTYANAETATAFIVRAEGGTLVVSGENDLRWDIKPIYQDTFEGEGYATWRFAFPRNAEGNIAAMALTRARTRAIRYERQL